MPGEYASAAGTCLALKRGGMGNARPALTGRAVHYPCGRREVGPTGKLRRDPRLRLPMKIYEVGASLLVVGYIGFVKNQQPTTGRPLWVTDRLSVLMFIAKRPRRW